MEEIKTNDNKKYDGFISSIYLNGKTYGIRSVLIEIEPITCPKCGASFELKYGNGRCNYCGTYYTTQFKLVEQST